MNRYLLDTNIVSELRKPRPHGGVVDWLNRQEEDQLFLLAVTVGELQIGIERTRRQDASKAREIEAWADRLAAFVPDPADGHDVFSRVGTHHGQKPNQLLEDAMIAATARVHHLIVATRNEADFRHLCQCSQCTRGFRVRGRVPCPRHRLAGCSRDARTIQSPPRGSLLGVVPLAGAGSARVIVSCPCGTV